MKRILLLLVISSTLVFSQNMMRGIDIKVGYNTPAFNFDELYDGGVGFHLGILYPFYDNLQFTLNTGYSKWEFDNVAFNLKYTNDNYSDFDIEAPITVVPLTFGIKYYAGSTKVKPYFSAELGFFYYSQVTTGTYTWHPPQPDQAEYFAVIPEIKNSGFKPMLSFGAGVTTPISKNLDLDFQVSMQGLYDAQAISESSNSGGVEGTSSTIFFVSFNGGINYYF